MADRPALPDWPYGLSEPMAAAFLGISASLFRREWEAGRMPRPVQVTPGRQVWHRPTLQAWLDQKAEFTNHPLPPPVDPLADEWDKALGIREPALPAHL